MPCKKPQFAESGRRGDEYYFSRAVLFVREEGGLPTSSFIPMLRRSLLAQIRLTACTLGICHPRFLCSGAKQTRNSPANPACSPTLSRRACNALHDRASSTLPFSSRRPRLPSRPLLLMCDLIRSFFCPALRLLNCLARSISPLHLVNSALDKIPLRYTLHLYDTEVQTVGYTLNYFTGFLFTGYLAENSLREV